MRAASAPERRERLSIALTADPELPVPPRTYGGIERIVDMLARGLVERGHEVTVFAHKESQTAGRLVPWPGGSSASPLDTLGNSATLLREVLRGRFDLVHSFSRIAYLGPILPAAIPKLMTYQRAISPRSVRMGARLSRGNLWFTAVSRQMMRDVEALGAWRVVYNGAPMAAYQLRLDPGPDAPLVFLGRIEEIKGPHLAIEIARRAGRRLVIAGNVPPEHAAWFARHVEPHLDGERVRYIGPVDDPQKNALLGSAQALLMPILWDEPFGIVMAEAMACGAPVVTAARGAAPEVVEDGVTGFVRPDVDGLVAAVARLPEIDRRACRERAERLFSDAAVGEGYLDVYADMLAAAGRGPAG